MNAIMSFIMSKRFIPVLLMLIIGGLFVTYGVMGKNEKKNDDPKEKYQRILANVGIVLERGHYSPKKIDDEFSQEVLKNYEETLDPDKIVFLESDIKEFQKKYGNRIDDEIHGAPLESFYAISQTYLKRMHELDSLYRVVLREPVNFNIKEYLQMDADKRNYPADARERLDYAHKRMKYQILVRYTDKIEERDSSKTLPRKADSTIIREIKENLQKQWDRYFLQARSHNSSAEMFSVFVNSITGTMDPHTTYMNPLDKRTFDESLSGTFFGIGAQLREVDGQIKIASLVTGTPAWKSGEIQPDDIILKVGQGNQPPVDVTSYALTDAVKLIRGSQRGSEVRLTLKKSDGTVKVVSLLRDKIDLFDVYAKSAVIEGEHKIGYIRLPEFYADFNDPTGGRRSSTDVAIEVQKLKKENVEGIIIDLRGNGGGSLQDVIDMVGLFVKSGPVVQVKGREGRATIENSPERDPLYTGPLTVMVDEQSASASEIFAAAIQDYHRGIIIGSSSTFGKGTVQRNVSLDPQSENPLFGRPSEGLGDIKLTFKKFYRINGGTTQLRGVIPDIIIPDRLENLKFREKDNPDALGWDTISKAKYILWNPGYSYNNIVREASFQIKENQKFEGIQKVVNELDNFQNRPMPLQLKEYKEMQTEIRALAKKLDEYSKANKTLDVRSIPEDLQEIGSDSSKIKSQELFIKGISHDIYVGETVSVVNDLIGQRLVALQQGELRDPQ